MKSLNVNKINSLYLVIEYYRFGTSLFFLQYDTDIYLSSKLMGVFFPVKYVVCIKTLQKLKYSQQNFFSQILSQKKVLIQNNSNVTRENVAVELFVF